MKVWDVLQPDRSGGEWQTVGAVKAPDVEVALLLARESHFRRQEGETYAVRLRGDEQVHVCPDPTGIGGAIGREFRRMDSFAGVGGKLRQAHELIEERGLTIDRPRPPDRRERRPGREETADA